MLTEVVRLWPPGFGSAAWMAGLTDLRCFARVYCARGTTADLPCMREHAYRIVDQAGGGSERTFPRVGTPAQVFDFCVDKGQGDVESIFRGSNIFCAVVGKRNKRSNFVSIAEFKIAKIVSDSFELRVADLFLQRNVDGSFDCDQPSDRHHDSVRNAGSGDARHRCFVTSAPALLGGADIQGHNYCTTSSNCRGHVPEVLRGFRRPGDDGPYTSQSKERDSDEKPDGSQMSDFPRAFHGSPVFDFWAIVARPAEGV